MMKKFQKIDTKTRSFSSLFSPFSKMLYFFQPLGQKSQEYSRLPAPFTEFFSFLKYTQEKNLKSHIGKLMFPRVGSSFSEIEILGICLLFQGGKVVKRFKFSTLKKTIRKPFIKIHLILRTETYV